MKIDENTALLIEIARIVLPCITAAGSTFIIFKNVTRAQKAASAQHVYANSYSKIYFLIENIIFSKEISIEETKSIAEKIIKILDSSDGYYYPSLKMYAEWMVNSTEHNYLEHWLTFSKRFNEEYDKTCSILKIPLRSWAYRLNKRQYSSRGEFWKILLLNSEMIVQLIFVFIALLYILSVLAYL